MKLKQESPKTKNRFDLEQDIMAAWQTAEDIRLIYEKFYENHEYMTVDDMANLLLGLQNLHHIRCERLFSTFEEIVHDGKFN